MRPGQGPGESGHRLACAICHGGRRQIRQVEQAEAGVFSPERTVDSGAHFQAQAGGAGFAELLDGVLSANPAQLTVHRNTGLRRISAWAAIIAVPTMISAFTA